MKQKAVYSSRYYIKALFFNSPITTWGFFFLSFFLISFSILLFFGGSVCVCCTRRDRERVLESKKGSYTAVINVYFHDDITQTPFFPLELCCAVLVRPFVTWVFFFFSPLFKMTGYTLRFVCFYLHDRRRCCSLVFSQIFVNRLKFTWR